MPRLLTGAVQLADGDAIVLEVWRGIRFAVVPGSGSTVTFSKVDSDKATAHDSDTQETTTTFLARTVDWPYVRVSTAGGAARVAVF